MKKAFTLAEVLVTLGIIGIISALTLPAINTLMPDKNKTLYLKTYDTITNNIKELANNSRLYSVCKDPEDADNNISCQTHPLLNTNKPIDTRFDDVKYSGDTKLCNLLAYMFNISDTSCSNTVYNFNSEDFTEHFRDNLSFTTQNGMQWEISPQIATSSDSTASTAIFQTDIYVDINGNAEPNCIYDNENCKNPDRFRFMVAADGSVYPADAIGRKYLETRKDLKKKKLDIEDHDMLANLANVKTNGLRTFSYQPCTADSSGTGGGGGGGSGEGGSGEGGSGEGGSGETVDVEITYSSAPGWRTLGVDNEGILILYRINIHLPKAISKLEARSIKVEPNWFNPEHSIETSTDKNFECTGNNCTSTGWAYTNLYYWNKEERNSFGTQDGWKFANIAPSKFGVKKISINNTQCNSTTDKGAYACAGHLLKTYNISSGEKPYEMCMNRIKSSPWGYQYNQNEYAKYCSGEKY